MARQFRLWELAQVVNLLPAAADAGGRTSSYISIKFGHKAFLICEVNQGNAATVTFTPLQATDNLGTNSKGLSNPAPIANIPDTSVATGTDQFNVFVTPGVQNSGPQVGTNFVTDAGLKNKMVIFEIDPLEVMDINNTVLAPAQFNHIAIQTSASNAANITSCRAVIMPLRDARQNPPTTYV